MDEERYEITTLLGKGRTGGVYGAEDTQLNRKVAVRRFYSAGGDTSADEWKEEFLTIAHNLSNLTHPNLLTVYDAGVDEDGAFLITQLLEGKRLSDSIGKEQLSEYDALDLAGQLLDGLASAHAAGFIHGALTAGSVLLTERARGGHRYMLMDLGLSRLAPLIQGADSSYAMMADPALLAPELFDGAVSTVASDCYMLGQLIYLTLLGGHPFAGKSLDEAKQLHQAGTIPPITDYRDDISQATIEWVQLMTQLDPEKRPATAADALRALPKLSPQAAPSKPPAPEQNAGLVKPSTPAAPPLLRKASPQTQVPPQVKAPTTMEKHPTPKQPQAAVTQPVTAQATPTPNTSPTPPPPSQTAAPAQSPPPPQATPPTPETEAEPTKPSKSKKKLILAIALPLLLVAGVCLAMMLPQQSDVEEFYEENPDERPINEGLESAIERANMTSFYSNAVAEGHSRIGCDVNNKGKKDWVVFSAPLSHFDKLSHPKAELIESVTPIGDTTAKQQEVGNLLFFSGKKSKFRPTLFGQTRDAGDGWEIQVTPPANGCKIKLHFTTWNCDAHLDILDDKGDHILPELYYQSESQDTSFGTLHKLTAEQVKGNKFITLKLIASKAKSDDTMGISLNALVVE
ncbi:serine/threonine protein kinase [Rubritalea tangerina]|uniref:non-specific serine/threonine protein kinase n=1 Tax=Rubritalea tangerina TaxID=430798 RepID=A0ABW4ZGD7_9BACT